MSDTNAQLRRIGVGFCGTVWAAGDHGSAFKREDGGPDRSLLNDYNMHQRIQDHKSSMTQIQIPICHGLLTPASKWWHDNLDRFPDGYEPCNMIHAQRIPPISENVRRLITERYCPPQLVREIMDSETNRDCLIRPYLGRRRHHTKRASRFQAFSLRNYPLHVDQMEELGISESDITGYAQSMAEALAVMHWDAEVDGNDVEFVLAAPNDAKTTVLQREWSNVLGQHSIWLLDFDLVRTMDMEEQGVQQAVKAFLNNDPFFPRPDGSSIWKAFREQYLQTSKMCIGRKTGAGYGELHGLPDLFIDSLEQPGSNSGAFA
ncbi:hypothetical protein ASPVEDRAFT_31571 [Aspergillus versicolor CBS 583.65]|uniref:DUF3669 domain-containing protein n=1 Tax=Aspergillus versicolor CBS 583.65 TaxID=1036611 RepID=A0A1L9PUE8_ASPVE|nr:uncharacterized protein ASPVEDRAFT_31571 [Aspergillus versicolor CBS 583.65]OJJ05164.1 hypothetical protein ASPVEDRAFT_31571 [Aspergillus versicolor CBS 583.65]